MPDVRPFVNGESVDITVPKGRTLHVKFGEVAAIGITININGGTITNHGTLVIDILSIKDGGTLENGGWGVDGGTLAIPAFGRA